MTMADDGWFAAGKFLFDQTDDSANRPHDPIIFPN